MFDLIAVSVAIIGSSIAGAYDLRTTEIPDWASVGLIFFGLGINLVHSLLEWNPVYIVRSGVICAAFFAFGALMYLAGQWGGGDAKVIAGVGALIPASPAFARDAFLFFPFALFINIFLVGTVYIIGYAFVFAFSHSDIMGSFLAELKENFKKIILITSFPAFIFVFFVFLQGPNRYVYNFLFMVPAVFSLLVLLRFLKAVEREGFKEEVNVEELEPGDMLAEVPEEMDLTYDIHDDLKDICQVLSPVVLLPLVVYLLKIGEIYLYISIFPTALVAVLGLVYLLRLFPSVNAIRGLDEEEVEKIRDEREGIEVREGVRFAPVFPLAILVSVYFGNILLLLI